MRQLLVVLFSSLLVVLQGLNVAKADSASNQKDNTPVQMTATAEYDVPGKPESPTTKAFIDKEIKSFPWVAETLKTPMGPVLKITAQLLFDKSNSSLNPAALDKIKNFGSMLAQYPKDRVTIVGHTDNTGDRYKNLIISKERAQAVKDELVREGIPEAQITIDGKGDTEPIALNDTPENRAKNRRIEIFDVPIN